MVISSIVLTYLIITHQDGKDPKMSTFSEMENAEYGYSGESALEDRT